MGGLCVRGLDGGRDKRKWLRYFNLFNTADIPFRFHLRVPGDGTLVKREFEVIPATGTILPHGKQKIQVDLIPLTPRNYNLQVIPINDMHICRYACAYCCFFWNTSAIAVARNYNLQVYLCYAVAVAIAGILVLWLLPSLVY